MLVTNLVSLCLGICQLINSTDIVLEKDISFCTVIHLKTLHFNNEYIVFLKYLFIASILCEIVSLYFHWSRFHLL